MDVLVVDYGMGNLWSVMNAVRYLGYSVEASSVSSAINQAEIIILPGVGSFRAAMDELQRRDLVAPLRQAASGRHQKLLGICLGMQLLAAVSSEDGYTQGLGVLDVSVDRFTPQAPAKVKVPHIGFSSVSAPSGSTLFAGLDKQTDFYFVHSFRILPEGLPGRAATCHHGETFLAAYEHENVFATQFHPEKSQTNGLLLLRNFLAA